MGADPCTQAYQTACVHVVPTTVSDNDLSMQSMHAEVLAAEVRAHVVADRQPRVETAEAPLLAKGLTKPSEGSSALHHLSGQAALGPGTVRVKASAQPFNYLQPPLRKRSVHRCPLNRQRSRCARMACLPFICRLFSCKQQSDRVRRLVP